MMRWMGILIFLAAGAAFAQEDEAPPAPVNSPDNVFTEPVSRDPAQEPVPGRVQREDELKVLPALPEAQLKKDSRSIQAEVYKTIYKRELKPDTREDEQDE